MSGGVSLATWSVGLGGDSGDLSSRSSGVGSGAMGSEETSVL